MATNYKKASDITQKTNIDLNNDYLMGVNGTSNYNIPASKFKERAEEAAKDVAYMNNIFILTYDNDTQLIIQPHKWLNKQSQGHKGLGVGLFEAGQPPLIVSTSQGLGAWCSGSVITGGYATNSKAEAFMDYAGRANTTAMLSKSQCQGAQYAAGFCNAYSALNSQEHGFAAGSWWLPSEGELSRMYYNFYRLNYALAMINGAELLGNKYYWSSTQKPNGIQSWFINFETGLVGSLTGHANASGAFRPVTTIQ